MAHRTTARQAGDRLSNCMKSAKVMAKLNQEEIDWMHLLQDRLYEIGRGRG